MITSRLHLIVGGAGYVALSAYGMLLVDETANVVPVNTADNWLHLGPGVLLLALAADPRGSRPPLPT